MLISVKKLTGHVIMSIYERDFRKEEPPSWIWSKTNAKYNHRLTISPAL